MQENKTGCFFHETLCTVYFLLATLVVTCKSPSYQTTSVVDVEWFIGWYQSHPRRRTV